MRFILSFCILVPGLLRLGAQESPDCFQVAAPPLTGDRELARKARREFCLLWYNAENLFHPEDDSLLSDDEFTPGGLRHWTPSRYEDKLTALAKVILAAGRGKPPELVGLCELENARVLEDLVSHPLLQSCNYRYIHQEGPDHRAMEVAALYREGSMAKLGWETLDPGLSAYRTREFLHLSLELQKKGTVEILLVHLISKYRGAGATAKPRKQQVEHVVHILDSLHQAMPGRPLVLAGDLNDAYSSWTMEPLRQARFSADSLRPLLIPRRSRDKVPGTYKYQGSWSQIDQVLVWGPYLHAEAFVLALPALLVPDELYGGIKPQRTYSGYRFAGGVSDHLPVVADLGFQRPRGR